MANTIPLFSAVVIYPLVSLLIFIFFGNIIDDLFPLEPDRGYKRDKIYRVPGTSIKVNPRQLASVFFRAIIFGYIFRTVITLTSAS